MQVFHESRVEPADIDNLGHMNVRVYARKAAQASYALAETVGLGRRALRQLGLVLEITDTHTRHYREQLEGAPLQVIGGTLSADADALVVYLELVNAANGERAATFRSVLQAFTADARTKASLPPIYAVAANRLKVDWPEHGQPRSMPIVPMKTDITRQDMLDLNIAQRFDPYDVLTDDCDDTGYMDLSEGLSLAFAKMPIKLPFEKMRMPGQDKRKIAIATMESRQILVRVPRLGDNVVTHSAQVQLTEKIVQFRNWSFNARDGALLGIGAQVGIGFDLGQRKAAPFTKEMQEHLAMSLHPELA